MLTATAVRAATRPGRYGDGNGLYLVVGRSNSASWMVRVEKDGRRRDIGLGSARLVSLPAARKKAARIKSQIAAGLDPIAVRNRTASAPSRSKEEIAAGKHQEWRERIADII